MLACERQIQCWVLTRKTYFEAILLTIQMLTEAYEIKTEACSRRTHQYRSRPLKNLLIQTLPSLLKNNNIIQNIIRL